jgi:hypothetical protein
MRVLDGEQVAVRIFIGEFDPRPSDDGLKPRDLGVNSMERSDDSSRLRYQGGR